jgi:hypothetical protein
MSHISVYYSSSQVLSHTSTNTYQSYEENIDRTDAWIMKEYQRVFTTWLMDKDIPIEKMTMKTLASRPSSCVTSSWQAYDINEYNYYTNQKNRRSVAQNSVIHIETFDPLGVKTMHYMST